MTKIDKQNRKSSSPDTRFIQKRRKVDTSKKNYRCICGKEYINNESLYTHRKTKHPNEFNLPFTVPQNILDQTNYMERDQTSEQLKPNEFTLSMFKQRGFLNFFAEMKQLSKQKEILKLFKLEKEVFTLLNLEFLEQGNQNHLSYLKNVLHLRENLRESKDSRSSKILDNLFFNEANMTSSSEKKVNDFTHDLLSQNNNFDYDVFLEDQMNDFNFVPMTQSYQKVDLLDFEFDPFFNQEDFLPNIQGLSQQNIFFNSFKMQISDHDLNKIEQIASKEISQQNNNYYQIAQELIKPFTEDFAMEMCYLFDKLIQNSSFQKYNKITEYKEQNQIIFLQLIHEEPQLFPKLNKISIKNRESFIEILLFNLGHLLEIESAAEK